MCEKAAMVVPGPICAFRITQFGPTTTSSAKLTAPSKRQPGSIATSRRQALEEETARRGIDRNVAAAGKRPAHVDARGIGQRHAGVEQGLGLEPLKAALDRGQVAPAVDAQSLGHIRRARRRHFHAITDGQRDHIGQEILADRVVGADRREPAHERGGRRGHDAGVDLADGLLLRCGLVVLDDGGDRAIGGTHDASVAGGIIEIDGKERQGAAPRMLDGLLSKVGYGTHTGVTIA